jgi:glycosyltransferase involved in cell wall biosynthesis
LKLLLLGSQMETGGAQRVILDQAAWFTAQGWQVTVAFLYDKEGLRERWQQQASFPIINLHAKRPGAGKIANLLALAGGVGRLLRLMQREHFDAVETVTHHCNLIGLPLAWLAHVPVKVGSHQGHILGFSKRMDRIHARLVNCFATRLVAVSQRVKKEAVQNGVREEKIVVIPNGVQLPRPDPQTAVKIRSAMGAENAALVLTAGRMTYQKAHTFLLKAAALVLKKYPNTIFALAGDGPLHPDLEAEAQQLGIAAHVRFLGVCFDLPQYMAAADIFALPSRWEGLPLVLLEAMGMGAAVVATCVEGVDEVIHDQKSGLLVAPEDAEGLADALDRLLTDEVLRRQMGAAAQDRVNSTYTVEIMCRQYAALLNPK